MVSVYKAFKALLSPKLSCHQPILSPAGCVSVYYLWCAGSTLCLWENPFTVLATPKAEGGFSSHRESSTFAIGISFQGKRFRAKECSQLRSVSCDTESNSSIVKIANRLKTCFQSFRTLSPASWTVITHCCWKEQKIEPHSQGLLKSCKLLSPHLRPYISGSIPGHSVIDNYVIVSQIWKTNTLENNWYLVHSRILYYFFILKISNYL